QMIILLARFSRHVAAAPCRRARIRNLAILWAVGTGFVVLPMGAHADTFVRLDYNVALAGHSRNTVILQLFDDRPLTEINFFQYVVSHGTMPPPFVQTLMHGLVKDHILQGGGYPAVFLVEPPPLNVALDPSHPVDLDGNPATANPTVANE